MEQMSILSLMRNICALLLAVVINLTWHPNIYIAVLHIFVLWIFYALLFTRLDRSIFSLNLLAVSCGGTLFLLCVLQEMLWLYDSGRLVLALMHVMIGLMFLITLYRSENFTEIQITYIAIMLINIVLKIVTCYHNDMKGWSYWGEYGCWSIITYALSPWHNSSSFNYEVPTEVTVQRRYSHTEYLRHPNLLGSGTPRCIDHYSDGSQVERW